jgi:Flp pilus assembly protein TadB
MPGRTPSPEQRARQQLREIRAEVLQSLKALDTHPDQTTEIFSRHHQRLAAILRPGSQQERSLPRQAGRSAPVRRDLPLGINLLWSFLMIAVVILVCWVTGEVWPVLLPLAVWVVVDAFVWTVGVPYLLFGLCLLFSALIELHL